jgi:prepilin-type N-terminal cleavage/methylation domain-containing protein
MNPRTFPFASDRRTAKGFSLLEMAIVLAVLGFLAALFLPITNTLIDNNRRQDTRAKLEALEAAMTRFVITTGRLPCPADGSLVPGNANQGLELAVGGVCTTAALTNGVAPWRTLAISQAEAVDAWGNLVTYRVWGGAAVTNPLTQANGMDMSACDPTGGGNASASGACEANADPALSTSPLNWLTQNGTANARGFRACQASPCPVGDAAELASKANGNGVAYFLISHGANKFGAFNPSGNLLAVNGPGPGTLESINSNGVALRTATPNDFYADTDLNENATSYYDDLVIRPTVIKVALDAGLGPRVP